VNADGKGELEMVEFWVWQKVSKQNKRWKEGREKREGARMLDIARVTVHMLNHPHIVNAHPQSERLFTDSHENALDRESGIGILLPPAKNNLHLHLLFVRIFSRWLFRRAVVSGMATNLCSG
jgi:hypothetical protein